MQIEPSTPRLARGLGIRGGTIVAGTALACAALMSACGSSSSSSSTPEKNVDTAKVAVAIEQTVLAKRHTHVKVTCPATEVSEPGKTFECIATARSTKPPFVETKTPFVVTIQNRIGYVTYASK
jgi:hypothetical protein